MQVVFQGHNHFYERINPINGVHYITTGMAGRSVYSPTSIASYSAFREGGLYGFTQVDVAGGLLTLRQVSASGAQIDLLEIDLEHLFQIDGLLDSASWQRAGTSGMLRLHAAIRGNHLYLATQDAGEGSDHFIYLATQIGSVQPANWSKSGQVMTWSAFLADENDNGFVGWFDAAGVRLTESVAYRSLTSGLNNNAPLNNGVLEGTINLAAHLGSFPAQIYVAAAPFGTADNGTLVASAQVPAGNGNGNIEASEFLLLQTRDLALDLPVSDAGPDQQAEAGMTVALSGAGSLSPSGFPLAYSWTQLSGPSVTIDAADMSSATVVSGQVGTPMDVVVRLRVNDTRFDADDTATISLSPMVDSDGDGLSDAEETTGQNNSLTPANPGGVTSDPNLFDTDGDGAGDGAEAMAGTDPRSASSLLKVSGFTRDGTGIVVTWKSVPGKRYQLERAVDATFAWESVGAVVTATAVETIATDVPVGGTVFYRVRLVP